MSIECVNIDNVGSSAVTIVEDDNQIGYVGFD